MKRILIFGFVLMLTASAAFATNTRVLTMGDNNNVMIDDANVFLYPSRVFNYPNVGIGEFCEGADGNGFYSFGVTWKFGEQKPWVLGTFFTADDPVQPRPYYGQFTSTYGSYGDYYETSLALSGNRRFDLLYGRKLGTNNFGFAFGYVNSGWKREEASYKSEENFKQYAFTFGLTPDNGQWDVAASLSLGTWTDKDSAAKEVTKPDGYSDIQIRGRYFHKFNQTITFVPHAGLWFGKHGQEVPDDSTKFSSKLTSFELGCGMHYQPVTNVLAVLDFGFQTTKITEEMINSYGDDTTLSYKRSNTYFPFWKVGLEGDVFNWLDVRFGAVSNWTSWKVETDYSLTDDRKDNFVSTSTYLGFGFNWNRLHVDTYTDPNLFLKGFNFISGDNSYDEDYEPMNWQLTVLYEMF